MPGCLVFFIFSCHVTCVCRQDVLRRLISVNTYDCYQFLGTFGSSLHVSLLRHMISFLLSC